MNFIQQEVSSQEWTRQQELEAEERREKRFTAAEKKLIYGQRKERMSQNRESYAPKEELTMREEEERYLKFTRENEISITGYGLLTNAYDTKAFIMKNSHIFHEYTTIFLIRWAIYLAIQGKTELVDIIARQAYYMRRIMREVRSTKVEPTIVASTYLDDLLGTDEITLWVKETVDRQVYHFGLAIKSHADEVKREMEKGEGEEPLVEDYQQPQNVAALHIMNG